MPQSADDNRSPWQLWPETEAALERWTDALLSALPPAGDFVRELEQTTSTRAFDWLDHITLAGNENAERTLQELGFEREDVQAPQSALAFHHPDAQFPRVLLHRHDANEPTPIALSLKCDRVADVLLANGLDRPIRGARRGPFREATLFEEAGRALRVTERCGYRGYVPLPFTADNVERYEAAQEMWRTRGRFFDDEAEGMQAALNTAHRMVELVGADAAAWLAFEVERDYWQRHNRAGQTQKARQDRMGFGWANHDHHTFRSSRAHFTTLIEIFHAFGFVDRERFYAGREAGWGAQIVEQPACGLVVFADVDLTPEEIEIDFARQPLEPWSQLGTVGLWCALHGESMLRAGMHHLEAQFRFDALRDDLAQQGLGMMQPFSDLRYLRQAFTQGEQWRVPEQRIQRLFKQGHIDADQAERFRREGAIGSHLENLQRRFGFKGFNQKNVSDIIGRTDPRRAQR